MPDPIVTRVVVDGVERWGSTDAKWVREAQEKADQQPAAAEPGEAEAPDATEDAAPSDGKDSKRTRR